MSLYISCGIFIFNG